mgnify:CR=1 FL=1
MLGTLLRENFQERIVICDILNYVVSLLYYFMGFFWNCNTIIGDLIIFETNYIYLKCSNFLFFDLNDIHAWLDRGY